MTYSVMLWLVHPDGDAAGEEGKRHPAPQGPSGVLAPPAFTHLSYGMLEDERQLQEVLTSIADTLGRNAPLRVTHGSRTFLIPASRVHYVVSEQVSRPIDEEADDVTRRESKEQEAHE